MDKSLQYMQGIVVQDKLHQNKLYLPYSSHINLLDIQALNNWPQIVNQLNNQIQSLAKGIHNYTSLVFSLIVCVTGCNHEVI